MSGRGDLPIAVSLRIQIPKALTKLKSDAPTLAATLWIIDEMTPVVARGLTDTLWVVMPMRIDFVAQAA